MASQTRTQRSELVWSLQAAAAGSLLQGWHITGSVLFTLSLNHKQMLMYFAPAFFAYLLGRCLRHPPHWIATRTTQHSTWPQGATDASVRPLSFYVSFRGFSLALLGIGSHGDPCIHQRQTAHSRTTGAARCGGDGGRGSGADERKDVDLSSEAPQPGRQWRGSPGVVRAVGALGLAVIATFAAVWAPFLVPHPSAAISVRCWHA